MFSPSNHPVFTDMRPRYRAPEVILSQTYDGSVDLWSIGCIFAELLGMVRENVPSFKSRRPLFPGESCGELSPDGTSYDASFHDGDQLSVIFDVMGTPTEEDLHILPTKVANIVRKFSKRSPINLQLKYPSAEPTGINLLASMLRFDPSKRMSVEESLHHPFLAEEQSDEKEMNAICPEPLSADIESISEEDTHVLSKVSGLVVSHRSAVYCRLFFLIIRSSKKCMCTGFLRRKE
jgi:serine/threonine protein kinase